MLGILFTAIAALWFGFASIGMRRGVATASALSGLYLTMLPGVPVLWLAAFVTGQLFDASELGGREYGLLAGAGVLHFLVGRYCTLRAMATIGITRASPVIVGSMLVSVGFAVTLLGEEITLLMGIGSALVLVGPGLAASRPKSKAAVPAGGRVATATARFDLLPRSQLIEGYAWAAGNALAFGTSPVLIREALGDSGLGILGAAVAYTTAGLLLLISLAIPGQIAGLRQTGTTARRWFILGALTIVFAQMFRFLALSNAPVSVVVPLLRGGVIVTLVLSFIFNRDLESFDRRVLAGIVVSLIGSLALVVEV